MDEDTRARMQYLEEVAMACLRRQAALEVLVAELIARGDPITETSVEAKLRLVEARMPDAADRAEMRRVLRDTLRVAAERASG